MEYLIFAAVILGFIVLFMVKGFFDYKKSQKEFIRRLRKDYGVLPQKEYKPEKFENISHYFLKHQDGFVIDDITWNDLNMDDVFKRMNYTYSAAGEEYLYYLLRKPCCEEEALSHREEIIEFFRNNPDERVAFQFIFSMLGGTGKFSIYDYLDYLDDLGNRSNLPHYLMIVLIFLSVGSLFVNLPMGILLLACVLIYNNMSYFRVKSQIDPYIVSFAYVFRILDAVKKLQPYRIAELKEELSRLKSCSAAMNGFRRGSFLLMSGGRMSGSGNPLEMLLDFVRMGFHLDLIKFNQMLSQVRRHISEIDEMIGILGGIEALIAVGAWRESLDSYCIPSFAKRMGFSAKGLYHPLIENPVKNDMETEKSVLITGSNASGKSTFLKTAALASIFAQTVHTVPADSYTGFLCRPMSSMSLRDDVQGGDSYYMVEIKALKRILDLTVTEGLPVLCFVDEVLRGTNTIERIAASTQILKSISLKNSMCYAATHDIELTYLLEEYYSNYHFEEEIAENDISFSYKIMEGRATTRNAIKLLGIMGYAPDIIREAEDMAGDIALQGYYSQNYGGRRTKKTS